MTLSTGRRITHTAAVAGLAVLLAAGCATRGDGRPEVAAAPPAAPAAPAPLSVTPARLDAYVLAVQNIRAAHPRFLGEGAGESQIREEMRAAVGRAGLTLEEFRNIHRQVEADPALRAEVQSRLSAASQAGPGTGAPATGASGTGAGSPAAQPAPAATPGPRR